jgi:hypothetical protein
MVSQKEAIPGAAKLQAMQRRGEQTLTQQAKSQGRFHDATSRLGDTRQEQAACVF